MSSLEHQVFLKDTLERIYSSPTVLLSFVFVQWIPPVLERCFGNKNKSNEVAIPQKHGREELWVVDLF